MYAQTVEVWQQKYIMKSLLQKTGIKDLILIILLRFAPLVTIAGGRGWVKKYEKFQDDIGPFNVVMFNPQIVAKSHPYQTAEGCLSLSGTRPTKRYKQITVNFRNQSWQMQTLELTDFAAEIVQHEIDHCNGIII